MTLATIIEQVKRKSPAALWNKWGYEIKRAGSELRVYKKDEADGCIYRSVLTSEGIWLSTMSDAGVHIAPNVGDNISLVQHFTKTKRHTKTLNEAIQYITYICKNNDDIPTYKAPAKQGKNLSLPRQSERGDDRGRAYLRARGISKAVISKAEEAGLIRFSADTEDYAAAVFFLGYKNDSLAYAGRRCIEAPKSKDTSEKRDVTGSSKTWIPVFEGNPSLIVFVEGGVNMLFVMELFYRAGKEIPTVIMTGGSGNTKWGNNTKIEKILKESDEVWLISENDSHLSEKKQELIQINR